MSTSIQKRLSSDLTVAVCQMTSVDNVQANLNSIREQMKSVEHQGVELFLFPENSIYMRLKEGEKIAGISLEDPAFSELSDLARQNKAFIHLGSVPLLTEGRVYNSSVLIDPDGKFEASYQKLHLFDIRLGDGKVIRESDVFAHGSSPKVFQIGDWKIGQSICYDMRFAELYSEYVKHDVDVILIPSAFLVPTGKAHWHILTRARAIESQAYVLAAAQAGRHEGRGVRETFGHSMVIDPWGTVLLEGGDHPQVLVAKLSKARVEEVRAQIPMKSHRRLL